MENQNQNHNQNLNEPQATKEELVQANNTAVTDSAIGVDAASDTGAKSEAGGSGKEVKRGRGRPRKYEVGGNQVSPVPAPSTVPPGFAVQLQPNNGNGSDAKRGRGRPRGSGKLQVLASMGGQVAETAGGSLTPHVLTVKPGEDVISRIVTFFQKGPRAVCVISACGTVSSVTLRQPGASGGSLRYEGRFDILSLTGSSTYTGVTGGAQRKSGLLSVSLAKPDGRVFGGGIENSLIAATPIQLVLGTFKQNISTHIKRKYSSVTSSAPNMQGDPDSARDNLKAPKLATEGESSCPSPSATIRLTAAATANGVADNNVTPPADDQNVHSAPVSGIDLDSQSQTLQQPVTDQITSPDVDANASSSVPQI